MGFSIIWQATVGHTLENNPQWDYATNPKIAPWKLRKQISLTDKPRVTKKDYEGYMPTKEDMLAQLELMYVCTQSMDDSQFLFNFDHLFINPAVVDEVDVFKKAVLSLGKQIKESHKSYLLKYDYILPRNIKAHVTV